MILKASSASVGATINRSKSPWLAPRTCQRSPCSVLVGTPVEHDQDGVIISDEFTNPHKRRQMVEKRARKIANIVEKIEPPKLDGPADADVTLIGFSGYPG